MESIMFTSNERTSWALFPATTSLWKALQPLALLWFRVAWTEKWMKKQSRQKHLKKQPIDTSWAVGVHLKMQMLRRHFRPSNSKLNNIEAAQVDATKAGLSLALTRSESHCDRLCKAWKQSIQFKWNKQYPKDLAVSIDWTLAAAWNCRTLVWPYDLNQYLGLSNMSGACSAATTLSDVHSRSWVWWTCNFSRRHTMKRRFHVCLPTMSQTSTLTTGAPSWLSTPTPAVPTRTFPRHSLSTSLLARATFATKLKPASRKNK